MSKRSGTSTNGARHGRGLVRVKRVHEITEYRIPQNGLRVLFAPRPGTGVVTTNILYFVGSRDEARGETGLAHMFEHMLFKPTSFDTKRKTESAAMVFERECGIVLNANTWKDRTTYYFSYPREHLHRALSIEAERMQHLVLTEKEFLPERTNVLSEFDMYAGGEEFMLSVEMMAAAFQSHPYGHETIGFREDIESYTIPMLKRFYRKHYRPENAVLMLVGDLDEKEMEEAVMRHFGSLKNPTVPEDSGTVPREPRQSGLRTVEVRKPSKTEIYAIGVKHGGFPSREWHLTMVAFDLLSSGKDSVLHRALVDGGLAARVEGMVEPTKEMNLGVIYITKGNGTKLETIEKKVHELVRGVTVKSVAPYLTKIIAKNITNEYTSRDSSLGYVAELTEYVSSGSWEAFFETEKMLRSITPNEVVEHIQKLFREDNMTIGRFIGTGV